MERRSNDIEWNKESSKKIFEEAYSNYNKFFRCVSEKYGNHPPKTVEKSFERIHKVAIKICEAEAPNSEIPNSEKNEHFPLVTVLSAYIRAILIDRFPVPTGVNSEFYEGLDTENFIWTFIFMYIRAMKYNSTKLLRLELLEDVTKKMVEFLFAFKYKNHEFNHVSVNLIIENLCLNNIIYQATMFEDIYNRRGLELISGKRTDDETTITGVIYVDGDKFKDVNEVCGHAEGDNVLRIYKDSIIQAVNMIRPEYRVVPARWGGEEFVICIFKTNEDEMKDLAKNIKSKLKDHSEWDGLIEKYKDKSSEITFPRTCSQGIALGKNIDSESFNKIVDLADKQLKKAKEDERNCIFFDNKNIG